MVHEPNGAVDVGKSESESTAMRNTTNAYVQRFDAEHRRSRRAVALLAALAAIVAACVFWQLHSTGIALSNQTYCGLDESDGHTHTAACLSDQTADVETADDWEATLPADLTGVWTDDVVAVAQSQLGYTESTANFALADDGETRQGYTRYGAWYGNEYGDWDALFASFCLHYADVDEDVFPEASGAYAWEAELEKQGLYQDAAEYEPAAGDLVFFDTDEDGKADRVGIVEKLDVTEDADGAETVQKLYVIEGDYAEEANGEAAETEGVGTAGAADAVCEVEYQPSDQTILGYGTVSSVSASYAASAASSVSAISKSETDDADAEVDADADDEADDSDDETNGEADVDADADTDGDDVDVDTDDNETNGDTDDETDGDSSEGEEQSALTALSLASEGAISLTAANESTTNFTVEYYAYLDVVYTNDTSGTLALLDTSGGKLPTNTTNNPKTYINLDATTSSLYKIHTTEELTKIYTSEDCTVEENHDVDSVNKLRDNTGYTLYGVWVSEDGGTSWVEYDYSDGMTFTNAKASADKTTLYIPSGAVVRLVYKTATASENIGANLYDYDITNDGSSTSQSGINSNSNYSGSGAKLAFGNNNTGTGLANETFNNFYINRANSGTVDYSCSFGIAAGLNSDGTIQYSDGIIAPALFNESAANVNGKTTYSGQTLTFSQVGDTYTLSSVSGPNGYNITDLEYFTKLTNYVYSDGTAGATFWNNTIIYTNSFWPMDGVSGKDGQHGHYGETGSWCPVSDDSKDHNSYFGMQYSVNFTLTADYCGPLNYLFFGDDDMWVFLTDPDGNSKLICDIGGVHSSVGEYVNLWDYINQGSEGTYTLTFFYTERGASGSTCYTQFTLPSVTSNTTVQDTGSLKVEKEVDSDEATGDETFSFTLKLKDSSNSALKNEYAYDIHNADGTKASSGSIGDNGTFILKDGQYIVVNYLPAGTVCTVTETETGDYAVYTVESDGSLTEGKSDSGSITDGNTLTMKFVNSTPDVEKKVQDSTGGWADDNTASIGSNVQFKTTINDVSGITSLVLHDKLDTGLANPYVSGVYVLDSAGEAQVNSTNYTVTYYVGENNKTGASTTDGCSFEIVFEDEFLTTLDTDDSIVVYYYAKLTNEAKIGTAKGNDNETRISYGAESYSEWDTTTTYTFQIDILKYSGDEKLSDAEFILYYNYTYTPTEQQSGSVTEARYAVVDDNGYLTGWTTDRTSATTLTSDNKGEITIKGLDAETYYLEETKAPDGYILLSDPVTINVDGTGAITYTVDGATVEASTTKNQVQVENEAGYELPLTGGIGTHWHTTAGALLVVGAACLLYRVSQRRKEGLR